MTRSLTINQSNRYSAFLALAICTLAAVPQVVKHQGDHAAPGARNAFQMLSFKPGRENSIAIRSMIAIVTVPWTQR